VGLSPNYSNHNLPANHLSSLSTSLVFWEKLPNKVLAPKYLSQNLRLEDPRLEQVIVLTESAVKGGIS
jgi:hypothetical protein